MFWVNMNDKFLSGWGEARLGRSILCIACDTLAQANAIERAAQDRREMRHISIADAPRKGRGGDVITKRSFADMSGPWLAYYKE